MKKFIKSFIITCLCSLIISLVSICSVFANSVYLPVKNYAAQIVCWAAAGAAFADYYNEYPGKTLYQQEQTIHSNSGMDYLTADIAGLYTLRSAVSTPYIQHDGLNRPFYYSEVRNYIEAGKPILVTLNNYNGTGDGHVIVIRGYNDWNLDNNTNGCEYCVFMDPYDGTGNRASRDFLVSNWGWFGSIY